MVSLYCASSIHNVLMCSSIAAENESSDPILIVHPTFNKPDELINAIHSGDCPFRQVIVLKSRYDSEIPKSSMINTWNMYNSIYYLRKHSPDHLYLCYNGTPVEDALLRFADDECTISYIEHGLYSYSDEKLPIKKAWKKIIGKMLYGPWWQPTRVVGEKSTFDQTFAIFPELVRTEIKNRETYSISNSYLRTNGATITERYLDDLVGELQKMRDIDVLVFFTKSHVALESPNYNRIIKDFAQKYIQEGKTVGIKHHPSEGNTDFINIPNTIELPQSIPAELIYMLNQDLTDIVGLYSTSLLTAKWLLDNVSITSLAYSINSDFVSDSIISLFKEIDIKVI